MVFSSVNLRRLEYLVATSYDKESTCSLDFDRMQPELTSTFQKAVTLQQEKKYDEAIAAYKSLLDHSQNLSPDQIADISYNAALASFNHQNFPQSYVFNQKALFLNPRHSQAKELAEKIKTQFQVKATPHDISFTENLNKAGLDAIPIEALWLAATITFIVFLQAVLGFYLNRKKEILESLKFSHFSYKNYIWLVLFLVFSLLLGLKIWEHQIPKALVRSEQLILKTAAGENQANLSELPVGSLVHLLRASKINDIIYYQIKYPGGISGWAKQDDLELISDALSVPKD
jgi:tetratricopeptide (TPR) repeat protein